MLTNKYRVPRGHTKRIVEELQAAGIQKVTSNTVASDACVHRRALEFLCADEAGQAEFRVKVEQAIQKHGRATGEQFGVWCLMQDNITSWEQVLGLWEQYQKEHPPENPDCDDTDNTNEPQQEVAQDETGTTRDVNEEEEDLPGIEALLGQTIGSLATNLETICLLNSQIREEHKDDMRRIKTLARQNKSLEDQLAQKTGELQEAQQEATRLRQQIDSLEAKLHSIERRKLSELATQVAGQGELGRRFYALAQQIGLVGRQTTRDALLVGFPDIITKQDDRLVGKHIIY